MNTRPKYNNLKTQNEVFKRLTQQVNQMLSKLPGKSRLLLLAKVRALLFPGLFIFFYTMALIECQSIPLFFSCYILMGLTIVLIFLNLIHELVHESIFKSKKVNGSLLYFFDLIGANSYIWKKRHAILHHGFPNVSGWDSDIEQASLFKIFPHETEQKIHRHQHRYFVIFYPMYLINWVFVRDFKDFFNKKQIIRKVCTIPLIEYLKLFFFKFIFVFYLVFVPTVFFQVAWLHSVLAMMAMLICAGIFALIILLTPHVNTTNKFPQYDNSGTLPDSWLLHQLLTTNDVSSNNWFTRNLMGNFNYHIAHHLFPRLPGVFAPYITNTIRQFAADNNLPYRTYSLKYALWSHYNLIRKNAIGIEILDDDM